MKAFAYILVMTVITISLFSAVAEGYLRLIGFKRYIRTCPGQYTDADESYRVAEPDSSLGWTGRRSSSETNPQGFRDSKDFARIESADHQRIMILGDSFMYGVGVRREESVPSLLEHTFQGQYAVYNLGVPGWGIDQMYLAYLAYRDIIHPDVVILSFIQDDVIRVLESYRIFEQLKKPSFEVIRGDLVLRANCNRSLREMIASNSILLSLLNRELSIAWDAREIATHIFNRMIDDTKRRGERFIIVQIPIVLTTGKTNSVTFQIRNALFKS